MLRRLLQSSTANQPKSAYDRGQDKCGDAECSANLPDELLVKEIGVASSKK